MNKSNYLNFNFLKKGVEGPIIKENFSVQIKLNVRLSRKILASLTTLLDHRLVKLI